MIKEEIQALKEAMKPTEEFLSEWTGKPGHQVLMAKERSSNNYMVLKEGHLVLWARTIDSQGSYVFIHSRDEMIDRMGEEKIRHLEENLIAADKPTIH